MDQEKQVLASAGTKAPLSIKQMLAYQIEREMALQGINRVKMAQLMKTSRAALNRLLDPENDSVTLQTMEKASKILGKKLQIFLKE
jgi:antitoxin HicB